MTTRKEQISWRKELPARSLQNVGDEILELYRKGQLKYQGYHGNPGKHAMEEAKDLVVHLKMVERREEFACDLLRSCLRYMEPGTYPTSEVQQFRDLVHWFLDDARIHPGFVETSNIEPNQDHDDDL